MDHDKSHPTILEMIEETDNGFSKCPHGDFVHRKSCYFCPLEAIIQMLDDRVKHSQDGIEKAFERIERLETDHLDQLNPHAFLILQKRIEELEHLVRNQLAEKAHLINYKSYLALADRLTISESNIKKIESHVYSFGDVTAIQGEIDNIHKNMQFDENRIDRMEKIISDLTAKIADIGNFYYREKKTPHKCPVCLGSGRILKETPVLVCNACEGKGVLWS